MTIRTLPPPAVEAPDLLVSEAGARAELVAALAATFPSYEYETTVTIDDSVMMLVSGEVSGLTEHGRVAKGGSVVEYLRTTTGEWVLGPGDRHLATDDVAAGVAPLDGLLGAEAFAVGHDATDRSVLEAVYAGGAFGVPDVDEVAVSLTIRNGKVSKVRYEVPVDGGTARVVTLITSQIDQRYGAGRDIRAAE